MAEKLVELPVQRVGVSTRGIRVREVKMVAPVCPTCQERGLRRWWEKCQHNPYFSPAPRRIDVPVLACTVCGEEVEQGTATHCGQASFELRGRKESVQYDMVANVRGVRVDEGTSSGRAVERQRAKGWVMPEEVGIAPMCEFPSCYQPNPKVQTSWGNYCCDEHASVTGLSMSGRAVEVFNSARLADQMRSLRLR